MRIDKVEGKEFVFANCKCCGQPHAKQQIIRIPAEAIEQWEAAVERRRQVDESEYRWFKNLVVTFMIVGGLAGGYFGSLFPYPDNLTAGIPFAVATFLCFFLLYMLYIIVLQIIERVTGRANSNIDATKKDILIRAGLDVNPTQVGMGEDHYYVLLPIETTQTEGEPA